MKNPNGYGSVFKLSGKRSRPYVARKTRGWNDKGHPIYDVIGYYATKKEALMALAEFNRSPYDIDAAKMTFDELFAELDRRYLSKMNQKTAGNYRWAFTYCGPLGRRAYRDIKAAHMHELLDGIENDTAKSRVRQLLVKMDSLAVELEIINRPMSAALPQAKKPKKSTMHQPYTFEEIQQIKAAHADIVTVLLYTGLRAGEIIRIKKSDVDLVARTITGGIKTEAGRNRTIPIHDAIYPIISGWMNEASEHLCHRRDGTPYTLSTFEKEWLKYAEITGTRHRTHDCRHTLRTELDAVGANPICIDRILGHESVGVGAQVYTHKTIDDLRDAINLIRY